MIKTRLDRAIVWTLLRMSEWRRAVYGTCYFLATAGFVVATLRLGLLGAAQAPRAALQGPAIDMLIWGVGPALVSAVWDRILAWNGFRYHGA